MLIEKKGAWTVEEFGKIVIAIVGILLMIPLIILLVNLFSDDEEANAQNFIKSLDGKIENLKVGETGKFPMQGLDGWVLTGWSDKDEGKPDKCFFNSCICVCPVDAEGESLEGKCQEGGFCRKVETENVLVGLKDGLIAEKRPLTELFPGINEEVDAVFTALFQGATTKIYESIFFLNGLKFKEYVMEEKAISGSQQDLYRIVETGYKIVNEGYLKDICEGFPENIQEIDAAIAIKAKNAENNVNIFVYLFSGEKYYLCDISDKKYIKEGSAPAIGNGKRIDAALNINKDSYSDKGDDDIYFFTGKEYYKSSVQGDSFILMQSYPRDIGGWLIEDSNLDATSVLRKCSSFTCDIIFIKDNYYYIYQISLSGKQPIILYQRLQEFVVNKGSSFISIQ